jgi:DNA-binding CsgD family transcriptional regulator
MALVLPGGSGIQGIRDSPDCFCEVLRCAVGSDFDHPKRDIAAQRAGVHETVQAGTPEVGPLRSARPEAEPVEYELTPHEVRVLKLLVQGHRYKTAAAALGVSSHTVSFHLRRVYQKLNVHSKSEAVSRALRHGLI